MSVVPEQTLMGATTVARGKGLTVNGTVAVLETHELSVIVNEKFVAAAEETTT